MTTSGIWGCGGWSKSRASLLESKQFLVDESAIYLLSFSAAHQLNNSLQKILVFDEYAPSCLPSPWLVT